MIGILHILLFVFLLILSVPVSFAMLITCFVYIIMTQNVATTFIPLGVISGSGSMLVLASPFFIIMGELMNITGITERIFKFADTLVGHIPGGLGQVNVVASLIFGGISGSAVADAAGLGVIEIKAMKDAGYDSDFSAGITAASSIISPIFPPSYSFVLFGVFAGVSIGSLFLGGAIVGIVMALFLMITVYVISKKRNYPRHKPESLKNIWISFKESFWALLAPVILIAGIVTGQATPTEASAIAVLYSLILGIFIYKEVTFKKLLEVLRNSIPKIGMCFLLIGSGTVFGWMLGTEKVADFLGNYLLQFQSKIMAILIINVFLLFIGTFMSSEAALIVSIPILLPVILELGINPVTFGVAMVLNISIGLLTPPTALILFVTSKIAEVSFERVFKSVIPYYVPLLIVIALIYIFPGLTLWLPSLFFGKLTLSP